MLATRPFVDIKSFLWDFVLGILENKWPYVSSALFKAEGADVLGKLIDY